MKVICVPSGNATAAFVGTVIVKFEVEFASTNSPSSVKANVYAVVLEFVVGWLITVPAEFNEVAVAAPIFGVVKVTLDAIFVLVTAPVAIFASTIADDAMSSEPIAPASKFVPADRASTKFLTAVKFALCSAATIVAPFTNVFGTVKVAIT
jgi:hypothetical protein